MVIKGKFRVYTVDIGSWIIPGDYFCRPGGEKAELPIAGKIRDSALRSGA